MSILSPCSHFVAHFFVSPATRGRWRLATPCCWCTTRSAPVRATWLCAPTASPTPSSSSTTRATSRTNSMCTCPVLIPSTCSGFDCFCFDLLISVHLIFIKVFCFLVLFLFFSYLEAGLLLSDIFEEIPLSIHNSHLIHAFLFELREAPTAAALSSICDTEFERLALGGNFTLTKTLSLLYALLSCCHPHTSVVFLCFLHFAIISQINSPAFSF